MRGIRHDTAEIEVVWRSNTQLPNVGDVAHFGQVDEFLGEDRNYVGEVVSVNPETRVVVAQGVRLDNSR